jgi:hypothetical protein
MKHINTNSSLADSLSRWDMQLLYGLKGSYSFPSAGGNIHFQKRCVLLGTQDEGQSPNTQ